MGEITFSPDKKHRDRYFTAISFSHPAKMLLPLQRWLIENYTKPGEIILDPMAGSGTILIACTMGRHVIAVELELKFVQMQRDNWAKIQSMGPEMGCEMGTATILQGDARQLEGLLVDKCVFSPPYAEAQEGAGIAKRGYQGSKHSPTDLIGKRSYMPEQAGQSDGQISSLPYGSIDAVISSPPYEGALTSSSQHGNTGIAADNPKLADTGRYKAESKDNIGNLKSDSYLSAMLAVYKSAYSMLKDGGLMILVTKNFIRNKQQVRLDLDTIKLCESAGFEFAERHYRRLVQQSFWRTTYYQRCWHMKKNREATDPDQEFTCELGLTCTHEGSKRRQCSGFWNDVEPIKYEDILIFRKGNGNGSR